MSCYPIGFTQSLSSSYIFGNHYCSNGLRPTDTTNIPTRFNVTGTSDPVGCRALVEAAMNFSINISNGESINYVPPRPTGSFYVRGSRREVWESETFDANIRCRNEMIICTGIIIYSKKCLSDNLYYNLLYIIIMYLTTFRVFQISIMLVMLSRHIT